MPERVERGAAAKVNLALHVLRRRADSYHELDTLAVFADIGDRIEISAADELSLSVSGRFAEHCPEAEANLALKTAKALKEHSGFAGGAAIHLYKEIPIGAGLGGGSADAAATLLGLNDLWNLRLPADDLAAIGETLGADVPMCLAGRGLRARGKGERIDFLPAWPVLPIVLVWPGQPVSTAEVFGALEKRENPSLPEPPSFASVDDAAAWLSQCRNDLEAPARRVAPVIGTALEALRASENCMLARMSGSGSACFGLYADIDAAATAAQRLQRTSPDWWIAAALAR